MVCQFIFKMINISEFDHLIACSDYFAQFRLLKRAFSMLNPFDVNDNVIFFYLHFTCIAVNKFLL